MKLLIALLCIAAASAASADEPGVEILGDGGANAAAPDLLYNVFGGQPVKLDLWLRIGGAGGKVDLTADLVQKANALAAPLAKDVPLAGGIAFGGQPSGRITVSLPFPKVRGETQVVALFRFKSGGKTIPAGKAVFNVYPADFFKDRMQDITGTMRLEIFGGDKRLGDFLKSREIKFTDGSDTLPDNPAAGGVYAGSIGAKELAQWLDAHPVWHGGLIVFCGDTGLLPGVFVEARGDGRMAKVTLPLLDNISTDPRSQETLAEIFNAITPHTKP